MDKDKKESIVKEYIPEKTMHSKLMDLADEIIEIACVGHEKFKEAEKASGYSKSDIAKYNIVAGLSLVMRGIVQALEDDNNAC